MRLYLPLLLALLTPLSVCVGPLATVRALSAASSEAEQTSGTAESTDTAVFQRREDALRADKPELVRICERPVRRFVLEASRIQATPDRTGHVWWNGLSAPLRT